MAVNLSPKARFQQTKAVVETHKRMVESEIFEKATEAALLEYQAELSANPNNQGNGNSAAAAFFKLTGAQEYIATLRALANTPRQPPQAPNLNLNHKA
jgi:hypothetical protein